MSSIKRTFGFASVLVLVSSVAFAGNFDIHKPSKPEAVKGVEVNVNAKNKAPTIAVQALLGGVHVKNVTGDVDVANQGVSVNTDIEVSQPASKVNVTAANSGLTAAVQVAAPIGIKNVGGSVNVANTGVGVNTSIKVNK